jgi:hypothetical protein
MRATERDKSGRSRWDEGIILGLPRIAGPAPRPLRQRRKIAMLQIDREQVAELAERRRAERRSVAFWPAVILFVAVYALALYLFVIVWRCAACALP